jgi:DNA-binding MarR family transcriptional regulator
MTRTKEKKRDLIAELRREVRSAQSAVAAVDHAAADRLGVNATDHRCLDILDQRGPMTAGALAERLGLSRSAVTTVLDRLEDRRYVRRLRNPEDRRQIVVALTPLLHRRAREIYGDGGEVAAILGRYSADQLRLLRDFVRWDRELNERRAERLTGPGSATPTPRNRSRNPEEHRPPKGPED